MVICDECNVSVMKACYCSNTCRQRAFQKKKTHPSVLNTKGEKKTILPVSSPLLDVCIHGREKARCNIAKCDNYASYL